MRVRIDETRRHHQAVGIDGAFGAVLDLADLGDLAVRDRDIGPVALRAAAIDHGAVLDDEIVAHPFPPGEKLCPRVHPGPKPGSCEKWGPAKPWLARGTACQAKRKSDVCR